MQNIFFQDAIIGATSELIPAIRISPFRLDTIAPCVDDATIPSELFSDNRYLEVFTKGKFVISAILQDLDLRNNDLVSILTTTGNYYVSSCVTRTIEKYCKWNREITDDTKAIFVIHEFGYAYPRMRELLKYGLPIIEDCAHSFYTTNYEIGKYGDYVLYSLPKAFNMQIGGLLYSKRKVNSDIGDAERNYIYSMLQNYLPEKNQIIKKRLSNYRYLEESLKKIDITPHLPFKEGTVPGVYMFEKKGKVDYPKLKQFMQSNGVECSVFYGHDAFFIPCHQNLNVHEMDYMVSLLTYFMALQ